MLKIQKQKPNKARVETQKMDKMQTRRYHKKQRRIETPRQGKEEPGRVSYWVILIDSYLIDGDKERNSKKDKPFDPTMPFQLEDKEIPAKEIRLAKILMDKPAPHCSAQSWAVFD